MRFWTLWVGWGGWVGGWVEDVPFHPLNDGWVGLFNSTRRRCCCCSCTRGALSSSFSSRGRRGG